MWPFRLNSFRALSETNAFCLKHNFLAILAFHTTEFKDNRFFQQLSGPTDVIQFTETLHRNRWCSKKKREHKENHLVFRKTAQIVNLRVKNQHSEGMIYPESFLTPSRLSKSEISESVIVLDFSKHSIQTSTVHNFAPAARQLWSFVPEII